MDYMTMHFFSTSVCFCLNSNSDDNLLKNIELFDRLSLSFNGRVLFIKDVIGDEICCWSFYGQGRKLAEVCCTSIVYATEKKQTKVRMSWDVFSLSKALELGLKGLTDRAGWKKANYS